MSRYSILYDRDCGFCRWALAKVLALDKRGVLEPVPLDDPRAAELLRGMTEEQRLASWHLVVPDGRVWSGGAAFVPLAEALGRPRAGKALAPLERLLDAGYRFVAGNRSLWGRFVSERAKRRADERIAEARRVTSSG